MTFGEKIKELRKSKKMTIKELSESSGLSTMTLSKIENNANRPSAITISKLSKALNYDLDELWNFIGM